MTPKLSVEQLREWLMHIKRTPFHTDTALYVDAILAHLTAQPAPSAESEGAGASVPSSPFVHRWYGSPPNRGDYIYIDGKEVAYLGDQHHVQVSNLVYWANKLIAKAGAK